MPVEEAEIQRLFKLSEWNDRRLCDADFFHELTEPEQTFHLVWRLEAEVNNGGFEQFFFNSVGAFTPHAAAAFRRIGANESADLIDAAVAIVGEDTAWADTEARQDHVNALNEAALEKLNELDSAFYEYPDGDLAERLYPYVHANKAKIGVPETFWTES
jgi:hypothetical protein